LKFKEKGKKKVGAAGLTAGCSLFVLILKYSYAKEMILSLKFEV
jgi:hypothetical protein